MKIQNQIIKDISKEFTVNSRVQKRIFEKWDQYLTDHHYQKEPPQHPFYPFFENGEIYDPPKDSLSREIQRMCANKGKPLYRKGEVPPTPVSPSKFFVFE